MKKVTRFEIINHTGKTYKNLPEGATNIVDFNQDEYIVEVSFQNDDKTLKVFISKK